MDNEGEQKDDSTDYNLVVPFLNADPMFCYGVEFGFWYKDIEALDISEIHSQYVRTENEEQMRLTCHRKGWHVVDIKPWDDGPKDNGWVFFSVKKLN